MALTIKGHTQARVTMKGQVLAQVASKRCLGIIIDETLLFKEHAEYTATKSRAALGRISAFLADVRRANTEVGLKLYNDWSGHTLNLVIQFGVMHHLTPRSNWNVSINKLYSGPQTQ